MTTNSMKFSFLPTVIMTLRDVTPCSLVDSNIAKEPAVFSYLEDADSRFLQTKSVTCVSVPSCTLVTKAYSGRSIIVNNSCDNFTAAALTRRVDFLPNL